MEAAPPNFALVGGWWLKELVEGRIYRKPCFSPWNIGVSCIFFLKPIQWKEQVEIITIIIPILIIIIMVVTSTINITIMITIINFLSACVAVSTCACADIENAVHASISTYNIHMCMLVTVSISTYSICLSMHSYIYIYVYNYICSTSMYQGTHIIFRYLCTGIYKTIYETIYETIQYLSIYLYQPTPPICQSIFLSMHSCIYVINII